MQRLFFLNGDQDLSSFLLVEFGIVKFPDYACCVCHHIFRERSDLLEYEEVEFSFFFFLRGQLATL
jgi:fanconi-associated nuclease 1